MTLVERLVRLLRALNQARTSEGDPAAVPLRDVRELHSLRVYKTGGEGGSLMLRRDVRFLAARGLVVVDRGPSGLTARMHAPQKPERLHLRAAEHKAIGQARRLLRPAHEAASPLPAPQDPEERLDMLMRLLRLAEEHHGAVTVADLARHLRTTREDVVLLAREAADLHARDDMNALVVLYPEPLYDARDDRLGVLRGLAADDVHAVEIQWPRGGSSPTRQRGLDPLGRFAYSVAECADRVSLIDEALAAPGTFRPDIERRLDNARKKLEEWSEMVAALERQAEAATA